MGERDGGRGMGGEEKGRKRRGREGKGRRRRGGGEERGGKEERDGKVGVINVESTINSSCQFYFLWVESHDVTVQSDLLGHVL